MSYVATLRVLLLRDRECGTGAGEATTGLPITLVVFYGGPADIAHGAWSRESGS